MAEQIKVQKGSVLVYRVFDIGSEISLSRAEELLNELTNKTRFHLTTDSRKSIIIKEAPLSVSLQEDVLHLGGREYKTYILAKLWDYGVVSITIQLPIAAGTTWEQLIDLGYQIENSQEINERAILHKNNLVKKIYPAIKEPDEWSVFEDYTTYMLEKVDGVGTPLELLTKADVAALILAENRENLSDSSRGFIVENALQYSSSDLAVIDWNSALLIEPEGQRDVADVIEFSLTHLLEMRHYDSRLENKLARLYDAIEDKRNKLLSNLYSKLGEESSRDYMEFSEFLGRIENSLKTVGDFYLAVVFRRANTEFRFEDWRDSISRKMDSLAQISELLQGELTAMRSHLLEIIVILLIAVELLPVFHMIFGK